MSSEERLTIIPRERDRDYPDPETLPIPPPSSSKQKTRPQVTLSELIPGQYVSTTARIIYIKTIERQDAFGSKMLFYGTLEDSTFKVPFISHRISYPLIRYSIYKFDSVYVHEFPLDKSLLLIITEHTKIDSKDIEYDRDFIWNPKIESIRRPVRFITLQGVITTIHNNSGLIKRCNKCKSIIYDFCPNKCLNQEGWGWDLRVSSRLYDGSGSIKMVLTKDMASRVLHRNLTELILLASQDNNNNNNNNNGNSNNKQNYNTNANSNQFQQQASSVLKIKIPDSIEAIEAVIPENISSSSYRSNGKLIVTDGRNLVFFPPELEEEQQESKFSESIKR